MKNTHKIIYLLGPAKEYFLALLLCSSCFACFSQAPFYKTMNDQLSKNNFDVAFKMVDSISKNNEFFPQYYNYFYKGFIFKDKYKISNDYKDYDSCLFNLSQARLRIKQVELYVNEESKKVLQFVSNRNYNLSVESVENHQIDSAEFYYSQYKKGVLIFDSLNYSSKDVQFYNACGVSCYQFYKNDEKTNASYFDKSIQYHNKALRIDSTNFSANYNIMIYYYNQGVENLGKAEYCKQVDIANSVDWTNPNKPVPDIEQLLECVKPEDYHKYNIAPPLKKALPYALKAHQLEPANKNVLTALIGIYYSIDAKKQSALYKKKLKKLKKT